jgi:O-antigen ligase
LNTLSADRDLISKARLGAPLGLLFWVCMGCGALLMLSGFRAPEDYDGLNPVFAQFKVIARLVAILTLSGVIFLSVRADPQRALRIAKLFLPIGLFCGYAICSTVWSALKAETLGQAGSLATLVLLALATSMLVRTPADFRNLMAGLMGLLVGISLILLITGLLLPVTGHMTRNGEGLGHATYSGSTAALAALVLILCSLFSNWRWPTRLLFAGMPVLGAVMIISANRLSMAITVSLIGLSIILFGSRTVIAGLLIGIGIIGTMFLLVDPDFSSLQDSLDYLSRDQSSEEIGSLSGRSDMWEIMWNSFLESPILGHGYFVTSSTGELYMWYSSKNWTAHNAALQALVTTGIVGIVLLTLGLAIPAVAFAMSSAKHGSHRRMKWFVSLIFAWYALWGILNESIMGPVQPESVVFFAIFGTMIGATISPAAFFDSDHRPLGVGWSAESMGASS